MSTDHTWRQTGSAQLGEELHAAGITIVFGVMGEISIDMVAAFTERSGTTYVPARHENAAVAMADGYARATGRVGVATVTYGPGLTNAVTGITSAVRQHSRVLLITGQRANLASQQGIDGVALLAPTGVSVLTIADKRDIRGSIGRAIAMIEATDQPVVLNYVDRIIETPRLEPPAPGAAFPAVSTTPAAAPDGAAVEAARDLILAGKRVVIVAGRGASGLRQPLEELGRLSNAALMTTLMAKGFFGEAPACVGLAGGFASETGSACMQAADVLVTVGAGLNPWTTLLGEGFPNARLVQIDRDPAAFGRSEIKAAVRLEGDASAVVSALLAAVREQRPQPHPPAAWWPAPAPREDGASPFTNAGVHPRRLCRLLDALLPKERFVVTDSGHYFEFPATEMSVPEAGGYMWTSGFGAVGVGLGAALGAALGRADRLSVLFIGDGGLMMSLGDLDTVVRTNARVLIVVMDDAAYGAEIKHLDHRGLPASLASFQEINFAQVARSLGMKALTLSGADDVEQLRKDVARLDGPLLVHARLDGSVTGEYVEILGRIVSRGFAAAPASPP